MYSPINCWNVWNAQIGEEINNSSNILIIFDITDKKSASAKNRNTWRNKETTYNDEKKKQFWVVLWNPFDRYNTKFV